MKNKILWWALFLTAAAPSVYLSIMFFFFPRRLGVDPVEVYLQQNGLWALRFLLVTLACSPLRRLGMKTVVRYRRMLGLYAFFYGTLHLTTYVAGWIEFDWALFIEDLYKRPFIYVGMLTWVVLFALAITSPKWMVRRLRKNWVVIHKGVFIAVCAAWLHLWMQSRASAAEPLVYLAIILVLLGERAFRKFYKSSLVKPRS